MSAPEVEATAPTSTIRVRDALRSDILAGRIPMGGRLRAEAVAERYQVSRTPAREAFMLLAREGLLEILPRRGAVVRSFDVDDVIDLYGVRSVLEPYAARLAATNATEAQLDRIGELCEHQSSLTTATESEVAAQLEATDEFHGLVVQASGSARLEAALTAAGPLPVAFRRKFWREDGPRRQSLDCHRLLYDALRLRRADYAETVMRMHLEGAVVLLTTELVDPPRAGMESSPGPQDRRTR